jgi:DNA-binding protein H-NS
MKKTYAQVIKQIETLKQEADKLRRQEVDGVVSRIREAIEHYGLTAADLGLAPKSVRVAKAGSKPAAKSGRKSAKAKPGAPRAAKYRDEAGRTWGGIGKRPQWLRDALAAGKTLQDFAVQ